MERKFGNSGVRETREFGNDMADSEIPKFGSEVRVFRDRVRSNELFGDDGYSLECV